MCGYCLLAHVSEVKLSKPAEMNLLYGGPQALPQTGCHWDFCAALLCSFPGSKASEHSDGKVILKNNRTNTRAKQ